MKEQIKRIMTEKGLSQKKLAIMSGVSEPAISYLFNGKRNLSMRTINALLEALDCEMVIVPKGATHGRKD